jgi:hypothetical protein
MKTITVTNVVVDGTDITITGTISDETFTQPAQRVTVAEYPAANPNWSRAIRLTDAALFCVRAGSNTVALFLSSWSKIAVALENSLTWPPYVTAAPASVSGAVATFSVTATSELNDTTYLWQISTNGGSTFANMTDDTIYSGTTTATLTVADTTGLTGYYYRCVVTNAVGTATTIRAGLTSTDAPLALLSSPADSAVTAPNGTSFAAVAQKVYGYTAAMTTWWQALSPEVGATWADIALVDGDPYSNVLTSTLAVDDSTGLNGYQYRCRFTSVGGYTIYSGAATLTVA